jgi:glucose/mannose-6-phosphate isomerase
MATPILDDLTQIKSQDQDNLLGGVESLADQIKDAWAQIGQLSFTPTTDIHNVIVSGMGGSGLGADIARSVLKDRLQAPIELVHDYTLPAYADQHTLVVLMSVSGGTEETVASAQQALTQGCQLAVITGGDQLLELAQANNAFVYQIDPRENPSTQGRVALGYAIVGMLGVLHLAGVFTLTDQELDEILTTVIKVSVECGVDVPQDKNKAKTLAFDLIDRKPILVAADFLEGVIHTSTNQLNENGKIFAEYHVIPELNHHLMEGLMFPHSIKSSNLFVLINSNLYHPQNQKRVAITAELIDDNEIDTLLINLSADTKLTQAFELLALFNYASFYLGILEQIDPGPLPLVSWFKEELGQK